MGSANWIKNSQNLDHCRRFRLCWMERQAEVVALHLCILSHWMMQELLRMPCVTQKSMEDELESIILLRSAHILQHQVFIWEGLHIPVEEVDIEVVEEDTNVETMEDIEAVVVMTDTGAHHLLITDAMITGDDLDLDPTRHVVTEVADKTTTTINWVPSMDRNFPSFSTEWTHHD